MNEVSSMAHRVRHVSHDGRLVDGDPLANLAVLQDRSRLLGIMKDGAFHKDPQKGPARGRLSVPAA